MTAYHFSVFRMVFGLYLFIHLAGLLPYGAELFSREGVLADPRLNLTFGLWPNVLTVWDTPPAVTGFLAVLVGLAACVTVGVARRLSALLLWYGWACLLNRNNLISNPSIPFVGILLLALAVMPPGEPWTLSRRPPAESWTMPPSIFWAVWIVMAAGYSFSGIVKWGSPSWRDGTALWHVANNPLARAGWLRDGFLLLPFPLIALMTWGGLVLETVFAPLCLHRRGRMIAWGSMVGMHLGIMALVDFADLTVGMLLVHAFTFEAAWLPARRAATRPVLLFDGVCALCHGTARFLLEEDRGAVLRLSTLQGDTANAVRRRHPGLSAMEASLVYVEGFGTDRERVHVRSEAVWRILDDLGGPWRIVSWFRWVPRALRDGVYRWIAANRYRWFGRYDACRLPPPRWAERLLP